METLASEASGIVAQLGGLDQLLSYFLIFLGAFDIVATFIFPAAFVAKIPKIVRIVNVTLKAIRYIQEGFEKMEKSKGGFTLEPDTVDEVKQ